MRLLTSRITTAKLASKLAANGWQNEESIMLIKDINIENLSKIQLTLSNQLDVIIDRDKVAQKIRVLGVILAQERLDLKEVKYVDLRFKEPIIGKK